MPGEYVSNERTQKSLQHKVNVSNEHSLTKEVEGTLNIPEHPRASLPWVLWWSLWLPDSLHPSTWDGAQ